MCSHLFFRMSVCMGCMLTCSVNSDKGHNSPLIYLLAVWKVLSWTHFHRLTIIATVDTVQLLLNTSDETIKQRLLFPFNHYNFLFLIKCQRLLVQKASSHETLMGLNDYVPQANRPLQRHRCLDVKDDYDLVRWWPDRKQIMYWKVLAGNGEVKA